MLLHSARDNGGIKTPQHSLLRRIAIHALNAAQILVLELEDIPVKFDIKPVAGPHHVIDDGYDLGDQAIARPCHWSGKLIGGSEEVRSVLHWVRHTTRVSATFRKIYVIFRTSGVHGEVGNKCWSLALGGVGN